MDLARTLQFLYRMLGRPDHTPGAPVVLDTSMGPIAADLYRPADPWCTVVALHGLALRGHRDPRLTNIGRALASAGVFTIAPRLDALAKLRLDPPASDTITAVLRTVRGSSELGAPDRIGIFGPSFAGSQSVLSAAEPDLQPVVSCILLIGAYADARELLTHVLHDGSEDPYGRLILIRHFLEQIGDLPDGLAQAIETDLEDQGLREDGPPELPGVLAQLPGAERDRFLALRDDVAVRDELAGQILKTHGDLVDQLTITPSVPNVRAPIVLLHGAEDPVIPPSQSIRLRDALRAAGRPAPMVATPLLDHGNVLMRGRALLDVPRVVGAFRKWFRGLRVGP